MTDNLKDFKKGMKKVGGLVEIAVDLERNKHYTDSFNGSFRDLLTYMQDIYNVPEVIINAASQGGTQQRLDFAQEAVSEKREEVRQSALNDLEGIVDDLFDIDKDKLKLFSFSVIPVKERDFEKAAEDIDELIKDYKDTVKTLKSNLSGINQAVNPQRFDEQTKSIEEYEKFISIIEDNKGLVKNIAAYKKFKSHLGDGEKVRPDQDTIGKLLGEYFEGLKGQYGKHKAFINAWESLAQNPRYLMGYYKSAFLDPIMANIEEEAKKTDLKKYVKETVKVMNPIDQMNSFGTLYSIS